MPPLSGTDIRNLWLSLFHSNGFLLLISNACRRILNETWWIIVRRLLFQLSKKRLKASDAHNRLWQTHLCSYTLQIRRILHRIGSWEIQSSFFLQRGKKDNVPMAKLSPFPTFLLSCTFLVLWSLCSTNTFENPAFSGGGWNKSFVFQESSS